MPAHKLNKLLNKGLRAIFIYQTTSLISYYPHKSAITCRNSSTQVPFPTIRTRHIQTSRDLWQESTKKKKEMHLA